jgi:hypothetical protein
MQLDRSRLDCKNKRGHRYTSPPAPVRLLIRTLCDEVDKHYRGPLCTHLQTTPLVASIRYTSATNIRSTIDNEQSKETGSQDLLEDLEVGFSDRIFDETEFTSCQNAAVI